MQPGHVQRHGRQLGADLVLEGLEVRRDLSEAAGLAVIALGALGVRAAANANRNAAPIASGHGARAASAIAYHAR